MGTGEKVVAANGEFTVGDQVWFPVIVKGVPEMRHGRIGHLNTSNRRVLVSEKTEAGWSSDKHSIHRDDLWPINETRIIILEMGQNRYRLLNFKANPSESDEAFRGRARQSLAQGGEGSE